jgi:peptide-methionine (S)-S-oxide reductase
VIRTRVGYAGGTRENPTYYHLLLAVFWESHDPTRKALSTQYKSAIFYHNEAQQKLAMDSKAREQGQREAGIFTDIVPYTNFYYAEDYHQKFYLRLADDFYRELTAIYPDASAFIASTAVARLNGYVGTGGSLGTLRAEIDSYGLSDEAREKLLELVTRYEGE